MSFAMVRSFVRAIAAAVAVTLCVAAPAFAQVATPSPGTKPGHPWHWWMALVALVIGGVTILAAIGGLAVQAPGFKKVQHKQGQPR
jgi:hypothetical protein